MTKPKRKPQLQKFGLVRDEIPEVNNLFEELNYLKRTLRQQAHHNRLMAQSIKRIDSMYNSILDKLNY